MGYRHVTSHRITLGLGGSLLILISRRVSFLLCFGQVRSVQVRSCDGYALSNVDGVFTRDFGMYVLRTACMYACMHAAINIKRIYMGR